jgi:hypothetical protein
MTATLECDICKRIQIGGLPYTSGNFRGVCKGCDIKFEKGEIMWIKRNHGNWVNLKWPISM